MRPTEGCYNNNNNESDGLPPPMYHLCFRFYASEVHSLLWSYIQCLCPKHEVNLGKYDLSSFRLNSKMQQLITNNYPIRIIIIMHA